MKVIFLQDVSKIARAGEVKEVTDGYGRNFLLPRKLALVADSSTLSAMGTQFKIKARVQAQEEAGLVKMAEELEGKEIAIKAKVGAKEHLYGSITSADIAAELQTATGLEVDKRKIEIDKPIRQLGSYEIAIRLAKDITPKIKVTVIEGEMG